MLSKTSRTLVPAARSEGLLIEPVGDETVIYDEETKEAHCLKPLAAAVFSYADGRNSAADIAELAGHRLGISVTEAEVADAVAQLNECELLDVPLRIRDGLSRRDAMKRLAGASATAAFAGPLITSLASPGAALAQGTSGIPPGCTGCGSNHDCLPGPGEHSGHCCQGVPGKSCNQGCCVTGNNSCHVCTINGVTSCTVVLSTCPTCTGGSVSCCVSQAPC